MRRLLALSMAAALFLGACGDDDKSSSGSDADVTTTVAGDEESTDPGEDGDGADLAAKLLTVDDLPAGFAETESESEDEAGLSGCASADAFKSKYGDAPDDEVKVSFERETASGGGNFIQEELHLYADEAEAEKIFKAGKAAFTKCDTFGETDEDGVKSEATIEPVSLKSAGDESAAFKLVLIATNTKDATDPPAEFTFYLVMARDGDEIVQITAGSFGDPPVGSRDAEVLLTTAVAKL